MVKGVLRVWAKSVLFGSFVTWIYVFWGTSPSRTIVELDLNSVGEWWVEVVVLVLSLPVVVWYFFNMD